MKLQYKRYFIDRPKATGAFIPYNIHKDIEKMELPKRPVWRLVDKTVWILTDDKPKHIHKHWIELDSIDIELDIGYYDLALKANPTTRIDGKKTLPIYGNVKLIEWIVRKLEDSGAIVFNVQIGPTYRNYKNNGDDIKYLMPLYSVEFYLILYIHDPIRFKDFATTGIGRQKAFGCGLLLPS